MVNFLANCIAGYACSIYDFAPFSLTAVALATTSYQLASRVHVYFVNYIEGPALSSQERHLDDHQVGACTVLSITAIACLSSQCFRTLAYPGFKMRKKIQPIFLPFIHTLCHASPLESMAASPFFHLTYCIGVSLILAASTYGSYKLIVILKNRNQQS